MIKCVLLSGVKMNKAKTQIDKKKQLKNIGNTQFVYLCTVLM